nr:right-handed parallel beta-helix repeat-containing protein [Rhodoferax sp.]
MKMPYFAIVATLMLPSLSFGAESCRGIQPGKTGSAVLKEAGTFCLKKQLTIDGQYRPWVWDGGHQYSSDDDIALVIAANDVNVDLKGNSIVSNARAVTAGVQSALANTGESTRSGERADALYRKKSWDAAYRNITIRNGLVDLKRGEIGIAFSASSWNYSWVREGVSLNAQFGQDLFSEVKDMLPPNSAAYPIRSITIEGMKIRSPSYGVVVQGAKTVIRDSVIETDSQVGIWIFGPGAVIENNTIIVHARDKDSIYPIRPHDAPIRLHQADGSIIRNNRIILNSGVLSRSKGTAAIDLLDSKNVRIENNLVEFFQELVRKDNASSFVELINTVK